MDHRPYLTLKRSILGDLKVNASSVIYLESIAYCVEDRNPRSKQTLSRFLLRKHKKTGNSTRNAQGSDTIGDKFRTKHQGIDFFFRHGSRELVPSRTPYETARCLNICSIQFFPKYRFIKGKLT